MRPAGGTPTWSVAVHVNGTNFMSTALPGPALREMGLMLWPSRRPFFKVSTEAQHGVLRVSPSIALSAGSLFEVYTPRTTSFTFNADDPCQGVDEDPEVLALAGVPGDGRVDHLDCTWPLVASCAVSHGGRRLRIQPALAMPLEAARPWYCFAVRVRGPAEAAPVLPVAGVARSGRDLRVVDLAPLVLEEQGSVAGPDATGVAPVAALSSHLSLCYKSRIIGANPKELVANLMPDSLAESTADDANATLQVKISRKISV